MSLWHFNADHFWVIALMLGIIGAACLVIGLINRALLPDEKKFGLTLVSRWGESSTYEGGLDGVRVRLDRGDSWVATWTADCAGDVELFAHQPMAALDLPALAVFAPLVPFDRPLRALFGTLRRLETPVPFGKGWSFYGAPEAAAGRLASRLPGPGPVAPWHRIELRGGVLEATLESDGKMSREKLQEQANAFRELLAAVRG